MSKFKFLAVSVVFAITYIACDLFFIFYIANKTDATVTPTQNSTSFQTSYEAQTRAYAFNNKVENKTKAPLKTVIIVD